ncbi:MAG: hypothetical protein CR981_03705 [Proteobacteria bacterium]|nr:MAG: hypothetical protein CR981_03705 [Pseudomonadota bacterium]
MNCADQLFSDGKPIVSLQKRKKYDCIPSDNEFKRLNKNTGNDKSSDIRRAEKNGASVFLF